MIDILFWILIAVAINWPGCFALSWIYCGILTLTGDVRFEGWVWWRRVFPVARFVLISQHSWFARAWYKWYGHAMLGCMIHRDEPGDLDDNFVEEVIVHELRHNVQQLALGLVFYLLYGGDFVQLELRNLDGYRKNWAELDARRAEALWTAKGRKRIFDFGVRR